MDRLRDRNGAKGPSREKLTSHERADGCCIVGYRVARCRLLVRTIFGSTASSCAQTDHGCSQRRETVLSAESEYAVDTERPCPANLTPGTVAVSGYDCGGGGATASQVQQAKHAISKAKAQLVAAEQECRSLVSDLKGGKVSGLKGGKQYRLGKSSCEAALPPIPSDSPPA